MNERIKELAEQAGLRFTQLMSNPMVPVVDGKETDLEKFAELIVRECMLCCERVISDPVPESVDTWLNGGSQCIQEIKEHFGLGMSVADKKQLIKDLLGVNND